MVWFVGEPTFAKATVGEEGLEPSRSFDRNILSVVRVPISPLALKFFWSCLGELVLNYGSLDKELSNFLIDYHIYYH